jgi:hypothetical protein
MAPELDGSVSKEDLWSAIRGRDDAINALIKEKKQLLDTITKITKEKIDLEWFQKLLIKNEADAVRENKTLRERLDNQRI